MNDHELFFENYGNVVGEISSTDVSDPSVDGVSVAHSAHETQVDHSYGHHRVHYSHRLELAMHLANRRTEE